MNWKYEGKFQDITDFVFTGCVWFRKVDKTDPVYADSTGEFLSEATGSDSPHIKIDFVSHPSLWVELGKYQSHIH